MMFVLCYVCGNNHVTVPQTADERDREERERLEKTEEESWKNNDVWES